MLRSMVWSATVFAGLFLQAAEAAAPQTPEPATLTGRVAGVLSGGRYSYLEVDTGTGRVWVACYEVAARTGETVVVSEGRMMESFKSPTLNRTFDRIVFASALRVGTNGTPARRDLPAGHPPVAGGAGHGAMPPHGAMGAASPHGGATSPHGGQAQPAGELIRGEVLETMEGGGYTYVQVRSKDGTVWAAADKFKVAKGDRIVMTAGIVMKNFESPSLQRTFDSIRFVDYIRLDDGKQP